MVFSNENERYHTQVKINKINKKFKIMSQLGKAIVKWNYKGNITECVILSPNNNNEVLATGEVKRYAKDVPDKRYARKASFKRAMGLAAHFNVISKEERTNIWNDFRNKIKQPVGKIA